MTATEKKNCIASKTLHIFLGGGGVAITFLGSILK